MERILEGGDHLIAAVRDPAQLKWLEKRYGGQIHFIVIDPTMEDRITATLEKVITELGRLDVLINNADFGNIHSPEETSIEESLNEMEINLPDTIIVTTVALSFMKKQKSGHIIQFSLPGGLIGPYGIGTDSMIRCDSGGMAERMAKDFTPWGIKVTIVEPTGIRGEFPGEASIICETWPEAVDISSGSLSKFMGLRPVFPNEATAAIIRTANLDTPPLKLLFAIDSMQGAMIDDGLRQSEILNGPDTFLSET